MAAPGPLAPPEFAGDPGRSALGGLARAVGGGARFHELVDRRVRRWNSLRLFRFARFAVPVLVLLGHSSSLIERHDRAPPRSWEHGTHRPVAGMLGCVRAGSRRGSSRPREGVALARTRSYPGEPGSAARNEADRAPIGGDAAWFAHEAIIAVRRGKSNRARTCPRRPLAAGDAAQDLDFWIPRVESLFAACARRGSRRSQRSHRGATTGAPVAVSIAHSQPACAAVTTAAVIVRPLTRVRASPCPIDQPLWRLGRTIATPGGRDRRAQGEKEPIADDR